MCGCEGCNQVVLRRAYGTLGGVCTVGVWGDVLEGNEVQHEEGRGLSGGLVVKFKVIDRKAEGRRRMQAQCETSWDDSG